MRQKNHRWGSTVITVSQTRQSQHTVQTSQKQRESQQNKLTASEINQLSYQSLNALLFQGQVQQESKQSADKDVVLNLDELKKPTSVINQQSRKQDSQKYVYMNNSEKISTISNHPYYHQPQVALGGNLYSYQKAINERKISMSQRPDIDNLLNSRKIVGRASSQVTSQTSVKMDSAYQLHDYSKRSPIIMKDNYREYESDNNQENLQKSPGNQIFKNMIKLDLQNKQTITQSRYKEILNQMINKANHPKPIFNYEQEIQAKFSPQREALSKQQMSERRTQSQDNKLKSGSTNQTMQYDMSLITRDPKPTSPNNQNDQESSQHRKFREYLKMQNFDKINIILEQTQEEKDIISQQQSTRVVNQHPIYQENRRFFDKRNTKVDIQLYNNERFSPVRNQKLHHASSSNLDKQLDEKMNELKRENENRNEVQKNFYQVGQEQLQLIQQLCNKQPMNRVVQSQNSQFKNLEKTSNYQYYYQNQKNPQLKRQSYINRQYIFRDLKGFLDIQKMSMPSKELLSISTFQQQSQIQQLQQKEQVIANGLAQTIQQTEQKMRQLYQNSPQIPFKSKTIFRNKNQQGYPVLQKSIQLIKDEHSIPVSNPNFLKFSVVAGNNSGLIKDAMLRRSHKWVETTITDNTYHFKWQPVSYGIKFDRISSQIPPSQHPYTKQLCNHFEFHDQITEKSKLFKNLTQYAIKIKENVFDYIPITFFVEIDISNPKLYAKAMIPFFNAFYALEDNKKKAMRYYDKTQEQNNDGVIDEQFIFRHFYNNKKGLIKQHIREEKESQDENYGNLKKHIFKYTMPFCHFSGNNLWLLKPTKLNRGRGIHVINNLNQIKNLIHKYCTGFKKTMSNIPPAISNNNNNTNNNNDLQNIYQNNEQQLNNIQENFSDNDQVNIEPINEVIDQQDDQNHPSPLVKQDNCNKLFSPVLLQENDRSASPLKSASPEKIDSSKIKPTSTHFKLKHNSFIIQKYIERPLLIYQRKFDIRVWVFINYDYSLYFFKEGYLRTSSSEFFIDPNNPDDQYVHLTNNAIQKNSPDYGNFEDGNQMSFKQFQDYIEMTGHGVSVNEWVVPQMKALILRSSLATRHIIDPNRRKSCFELFGYDFIIDEDFNVWLIEVNTNPCIEESSQILKTYLPRMIDDMLKLSVDQFFLDFQNPNSSKQAKHVFPVDGYDDDENMWELQCNLKDKKSRKEAKLRLLQPIKIRSKYAFSIRERNLKIKKYNNEEKVQNGVQAVEGGGSSQSLMDAETMNSS